MANCNELILRRQLNRTNSDKIFAELWGAENFINAFSDEGDARLERENQGEVVLLKYLKPALRRLNSGVSTEAVNLAIDEIMKDRSAMSMVNANHEIWRLLRDGVKVETENEKGERKIETVKIIDFENPEENHFMIVSQLWITGELYKRRAPAYTEQDCENRTQKVYLHVYDNYVDAEVNVYARQTRGGN